MRRPYSRRGVAVLVAMVALSVLGAVPDATRAEATTDGFDDVPADAFYSAAVSSLAARGVFKGTECATGKLCPVAPLDRKTMAVWIVRVIDNTDPAPLAETRFPADVVAGSFHAPFIERMAELAITFGCDPNDGTRFCPNRSVTRSQMAAFLTRAYKLPAAADPPTFTDVPINAWYAQSVASLAASGITQGCDDGTRFCPNDNVTRGQMAAFLHRAEAAQHRRYRADPLGSPPRSLGLDAFYEKYLDAGGIPILSASDVPDEALHRAKDIIGEMLSDRADLTASMARDGIRVVVLGKSGSHSELPEWVEWIGDPGEGELRGFFLDPLVVTSEENLLCYPDDPHGNGGEVLIHELAHAVHFVGIEKRQPGAPFGSRLETMFTEARAAGLWDHTYAATNSVEYWAEGAEIWFGINEQGNGVNTRRELEDYDPSLAGLVTEVFGDATVSSSCNGTYSDDRRRTLIHGVLSGPEGRGLPETWLLASTGVSEDSSWALTDSDGVFWMWVPDGSFTLDVYAAPGTQCAGWYDGDGGITTIREQAERLTASGTAIKSIAIQLPAPPEDLPSIQC